MKSLVALLSLTASAVVAAPVAPTTPFNFSKQVSSNDAVTVETDPTTLTASTVAGKRQVAAMFRITVKDGISSTSGPTIFTFVNAIVADCKEEKVTVVASINYGGDGRALSAIRGPLVYEDTRKSGVPTTESRAYLCASKTPSTAAGVSSNERYKLFWKSIKSSV
jgi:hypothetical protein